MLSLLLQIPAFAPTGQVDFIKLILEQILRINPSLIAQYPIVQDKILWLVLVPHVVVFLFLFCFASWIVPKHAGLRRVLSVVTYLVLIVGGYYGSFIVPLVNAWFTILLVSGFLFFLLSRIFPPTSVQAGTGILGEILTHATAPAKKRKELEREIKELDNAISELEQYANQNPQARKAIAKQIAGLRAERARKQSQLEEAGG